MVEFWLRWHIGTCLDPKWKIIARRSGQPIHAVIAVWAMMLECAAQASTRGTLDGWIDEDAAAALDLDHPGSVTAIRDAMQGKVLDGDRVMRWDKRQPKREDSSAARTRDYRARKEASRAAGDGAKRGVTQGDAERRVVTLGDPRGDKNREEEKRERDTENHTEDPSPPRAHARGDASREYAFAGRVVRLTEGDFNQWAAAYGHLDLAAELTARDAYLAGPEVNDRDRKNWFQSTSKYLANRNAEMRQRARAGPEKPRGYAI